MTRIRFWAAMVVAFLLISASGAGVSGDNSMPGMDMSSAKTAAAAQGSFAGTVLIELVVTDTLDPNVFNLAPKSATIPEVKAGQRVQIIFWNQGAAQHHLVIHDYMDMGMDHMDMPSYSEVDLASHAAAVTKPFSFPKPGSYDVMCHTPGHQMEQGITVD